MRALCLATLSLHAVACTQHDGRLIVVVESDMPELIEVGVATRRLMGPGIDTRDFPLGRDITIPFSFAVEPNGNPSDGVEIHVDGYDCTPGPGCMPLVSRTVRTGFVRNSTRILPIFLSARCRSRPPCDDGQTCDPGDGMCHPIVPIDPLELRILSVGGGELDARDAPAALDAPGLDTSRADVPGLDAPEPDAALPDVPGLDAPGLDAPDLDAPALDTPDTALPDVGPPFDAGMDTPPPPTDAPRSCTDIYGGIRGYQVCPEEVGSCIFYFDTLVPASCDFLCEGVGGSALTSFRASPTPTCVRGLEVTPDTDISEGICVCSHPP